MTQLNQNLDENQLKNSEPERTESKTRRGRGKDWATKMQNKIDSTQTYQRIEERRRRASLKLKFNTF